jgi:hypothetical protein
MSQNVGIGTSTPTDGKLHVVNSGNSTAGMFSDGTTGVALINENNRPGVGLNMYYSGSDYKFKGAGFGGLFFYVPGEGRMTYYSSTVTGTPGAAVAFRGIMTLEANGTVGIGTTSPNFSRVEIHGPSNTSHLLTSGGSNKPGISHSAPFDLSPSLGFNLYYANAFRFMSPGYGAQIQYSPSTGILYFSTTQTNGATGDLALFNSSSVAIDSNGYLGVGTTAPKARLHATSAVIGASASLPAAGYVLSVDGKVICEEVKVQNSTAWPDYVFEEQYPMLTLTELEQRVMQQKHLPGMLSASDVDAGQGYELGDMQKRLLERVEVLYRYMFLMNKENQALKAELQALKGALDKKP